MRIHQAASTNHMDDPCDLTWRRFFVGASVHAQQDSEQAENWRGTFVSSAGELATHIRDQHLVRLHPQTAFSTTVI